jgi:NADPH:quinone reductase-like Zn-dependent oxidoreductase
MSNHAIVIKQAGEAEIREVSIPKLRDDYILVKVRAVALNPTDWKHVDYLASPGVRVGCDYAGIVEEVGKKVTKNFKKGDRVSGFCHGANAVNHEDGSFGEIITAKGDLQIHIPENMSFEEAATLGVGISTVGQGLYQSLKLPLPNDTEGIRKTSGTPILIYGGSTATGSLAIQFAKLSGWTVVATASPRNFDYVKSLGADVVFDYNSPTCSKDIREYTKDKLAHVFDCISEGDSTKISVESIGPAGGVYSTLLPVPNDKVHNINEKVTNHNTLAYSVVGEACKFGPKDMPAKPEDFEFAKMFWELARSILQEGKVKVHRISVNEGGKGLEGVLKGMDLMRQGKVSGRKLVYTL